MIVYHGSTLAVAEPRIVRNALGRDFGFAFYVTEIKEQAERWGCRKAEVERINGNTLAQPVVSVYEFDDARAKTQLKWLDFPQANMVWLDMILACRGNSEYVHGYDIVSGKIADDKVGMTVTYVQQGIMRREDAIERLKFQKINSQIAFCTPDALRMVAFVEAYNVEARKC